MPADMNDYFKKKKPSNTSNNSSGGGGGSNFNNPLGNMGKGATFILIALLIGFALFALKPFAIINSGEVGIKVRTGKFDDNPLQPGLHFYIPVFQKIIPVNTRIRLITYSNARTSTVGDDYARGLSSETFEGGLKRTLQFRSWTKEV